MHTDPIDMSQADAWLEHLRQSGRKENTLATHRSNVRRCLLFLRSEGRPTDAHGITSDDARLLWRVLPVKEEVRIAYLRSLSAMVRFHTGRDILRDAAILRNRESRERVFIRDSDFAVLFGHADEEQRLILALGALMGLRRGEMASLRDGDLSDGRMTIRGKGHGEGLVTRVPVPGIVAACIESYRSSRFKAGERADDFLLQSRGWDGRLHAVRPGRISDRVRSLGEAAGVRVTAHSLRRYYATTLYYSTGCDLQTVRVLMRHADVSTTLRCYVDAWDGKAMDATERLLEHIGGVIGGS